MWLAVEVAATERAVAAAASLAWYGPAAPVG